MTGVSIKTVSKFLIDAGLACARFYDETVHGVIAKAFCRVHKTLGATPAMAAGLIDRVMKVTDEVALIDAANSGPDLLGLSSSHCDPQRASMALTRCGLSLV